MWPKYQEEHHLKVKPRILKRFQNAVKYNGGRFIGNPIVVSNDATWVDVGFPKGSNPRAFNLATASMDQPYF